MHIGKRFKEKCVLLQVDNKYILYVTELNFLVVYVCAGQLLKFSGEHLRSKFYRTFICTPCPIKLSRFVFVRT